MAGPPTSLRVVVADDNVLLWAEAESAAANPGTVTPGVFGHRDNLSMPVRVEMRRNLQF
jgi:hypothetical protein